MNIVGTTWLWVTWYFSIEREVLLGVEVLHRHDRAAEGLRGEAEAQRSGVVEGRRREVDLRVVDAEQHLRQPEHAGRPLPRSGSP